MTMPPSQKFRRIGFMLSGGIGGATSFDFSIRPEELTVTEPSRLTVQQTLSGAWADSWDRGVATITLAGHCGWRGGITVAGEDLFFALRKACFLGWHTARADAIAQGQDPDTIKLYFTDNLDNVAVIVAPKTFTLRRSKTSPLLIRYNIVLTVLGGADTPLSPVDQVIYALSNPLRWLAATLGLTQLLDQINRFVGLGQAVFGAAAGAIQQVVGVGVHLIASIAGVAAEVQGQFSAVNGALLDIGMTYSRACSTAFSVLADDETLSDDERLPVSGLASAFYSASCSMANGYNLIEQFPSYAAFRGASTCSSTGGGDPASPFTVQDVNPFSYALPSAAAPVTMTADARAAMTALGGDPLLLRGQQPQVTDLMRRMGAGVVVA